MKIKAFVRLLTNIIQSLVKVLFNITTHLWRRRKRFFQKIWLTTDDFGCPVKLLTILEGAFPDSIWYYKFLGYGISCMELDFWCDNILGLVIFLHLQLCTDFLFSLYCNHQEFQGGWLFCKIQQNLNLKKYILILHPFQNLPCLIFWNVNVS